MRKLITLVAGAGLAAPAVSAAFIADGNLAAMVGATISTVALTMVVVGWIDRRIDHKIKSYAATVRIQHFVTLRELSNLRELLGHPPLNIPEILKGEQGG